MLSFLVSRRADSAKVEPMNHTAVDEAHKYYFQEFGTTNVGQYGLLNGAPYLCSAALCY